MVSDRHTHCCDLFFEGSPLPAAMMGEGGRIERANAALCASLGYTEVELQEKTVPDLVVAKDRAVLTTALAALSTPGAVGTVVCQGARKDGAIRRLQLHCSRSPDGAWVFVNVLDITETRQELEELKRTELRFQSIIRYMPLAFIELSPVGEILSWNPAAERIFGYSAAETIGRMSRELVVPEGAPDESEKHVAALLYHGHSFTISPNITKDGRRLVCEWHIMVARDESGGIPSLATLVQDITERSRTEHELRRRLEIIEDQRSAIRAMSMPIIQVSDGVLALPVIGDIDAERASQIMATLLQAVVDAGARYVVIDLTGVAVVEESTADHVVRLVTALALIGARTLVTGISPAVASTMVSLGLDLSRVSTAKNLKDAIQLCTSEAR